MNGSTASGPQSCPPSPRTPIARHFVRRLFGRAFAPVLLMVFYWPALTGWFFQDDFGWLRLRLDVHSVADLPSALFAPKAHGNMRPLGENAYWLGLGKLFGVDALPFHIVTFATEIAALLLLGAVIRRLTQSDAAAWGGQVLWVLSCGLAPSMGWSSIYNQVLSGFFFLLAFYFLLRFQKSRESRWWLAHWIAFVLGLGALETNVVYPVLAAVAALLWAPALLKKILPMFAVAALSAAVHFHFAPAPQGGPYAPRLDARIFGTVWTYWTWALGRMPVALAALLAAAAVTFALRRALLRDYLPLFGLAWFVVTLGPYLPLPDHKMDYYLAVPSIGIGMLGASAIAACSRSSLRWKLAAAACVVCFAGFSSRAAWAVTRWEHDRGLRVEDFVQGVAEIRGATPGKAILLDGMDDELFWAAMVNLPFHAMRIPEVFLAPNGTQKIQAPADVLRKYVLPLEVAVPLLRAGEAVAYRVDSDLLRNETRRYLAASEAGFRDATPRFVNIGDAIFSGFLGAGWGPAAGGYRSMHGSASLRIGGPRGPGESLYIGVLRTHDLDLRVSVDGSALPLSLAFRDNDLSELRAPLPAALLGRPELEVTLTTSLKEPLVFGYAEIK